MFRLCIVLLSISSFFICFLNPTYVYGAWINKEVEVGRATWISKRFHGKTTASGEKHNCEDLVAAHRTLPFGTFVRVTNLEDNKSVVVRINDRKPYSKVNIISVSWKAAQMLDTLNRVPVRAKLEVVNGMATAGIKNQLTTDVKRDVARISKLTILGDADGTWEKANLLTVGKSVSDKINAPAWDKEDWYRFSVPENEEEIKIRLTNKSAEHPLNLILYDSSRKRLKISLVTQGSKTNIHSLQQSGTFGLRVAAAKSNVIADYQLIVEYVDFPPTVQILRPRSGASLHGSEVEIELQVSDDRGVASVTVNGFSAVREPDGNYIAMVGNLKDGANTLSATVRDTKGQKASDKVDIRVDLPRRLGLVIGVKEYKYFPERNLKYSASDAQKVARSMRKHGFDIPDDRWVLVGLEATRYDVKGRLAELQSLATSNDTVFIYFSGHGVKGNFDCLVTHDAREDDEHNLLPNTVISTAELRADLKLINATKLIVALDSCYSGGAMKWRPLESGGDSKLPLHTVMIASSDGEQPSWQSDSLKGGIFTHYLLKVLEDESVADKNQDGTTTLREIESYLQKQVPAQSKREPQNMEQVPIVKTQQATWWSRGLFEK